MVSHDPVYAEFDEIQEINSLVMPDCVVCDDSVESENDYLCEKCFKELMTDREDALECRD